jgi:hypothetical protein
MGNPLISACNAVANRILRALLMPVIAEDRDEFLKNRREMLSPFADRLLGPCANSLSSPSVIENFQPF